MRRREGEATRVSVIDTADYEERMLLKPCIFMIYCGRRDTAKDDLSAVIPNQAQPLLSSPVLLTYQSLVNLTVSHHSVARTDTAAGTRPRTSGAFTWTA